MDAKLANIADELSVVIRKTLEAFAAKFDSRVKILACDFHPWNSFLALAILTEAEVEADPLLDDLAEMAAWKYYDFGANLEPWKVDSILASLKAIYDEFKDAEPLFRCCAAAMAAASVQQVVSQFSRSADFRISVASPDDNQEFFV